MTDAMVSNLFPLYSPGRLSGSSVMMTQAGCSLELWYDNVLNVRMWFKHPTEIADGTADISDPSLPT
jgi:hypothetical protein